MEQYSGFARVYDLFMDNVPYDEWVQYLCGLLEMNGVAADGTHHPLVCELGCGTGSVTRRLSERGYDMIGIDISDEMLQIAREREPQGDDRILYLQQDMREFELYGTVAAVVSLCDSMNYITDSDDLLRVFRLVNNYLDPGGIFIFDLNTSYYYSRVLGEQTICENRDEGSFIWENYYDPETHINEFDMTIYYKSSMNGGNGREHYVRCEETHFQRAYTLGEIRRLLKQAGMETLGIYAACTMEAPTRTTERVYVAARTRKAQTDMSTANA